MRLVAALSLVLCSSAAWAGGRKKAPEPGWKQRPYVNPMGGASSFSNGRTQTTAAYAGTQAGLRYRQVGRPFPRIKGDLRLQGTYTWATGNVRGYELRLGNLIGPQWRHVGLQTGPDLFTNAYQYGDTQLPATSGLAWPAIATGRFKALSGYAGVEPAWYLTDNRAGVDWSATDAVGVGDEFSLLGGVGVQLDKLRVGLNARRRTTAYGTDNSFGVSASFNAFPGGRR